MNASSESPSCRVDGLTRIRFSRGSKNHKSIAFRLLTLYWFVHKSALKRRDALAETEFCVFAKMLNHKVRKEATFIPYRAHGRAFADEKQREKAKEVKKVRIEACSKCGGKK